MPRQPRLFRRARRAAGPKRARRVSGRRDSSVRACEPAPRTMPSAGTDGETNDEIAFNDGMEDEL